jgi:amino acid permease
MSQVEIDSSLTVGEDKDSLDNLLWKATGTVEHHRKRARSFFTTSALLALVSFILLILALGNVLIIATHLALGLPIIGL